MRELLLALVVAVLALWILGAVLELGTRDARAAVILGALLPVVPP